MLFVASSYLVQLDACDSKRKYLCSIVSGEVREISKVVDVLFLLGRKQQYFVHGTIVLFTLHTLLNAIIRCLQLNTGRCSDDNLKVDYYSYMQLDYGLCILL